MAIKLPFKILADDQNANDKINQNEETLAKVKLESRWRRSSSGTTSYIYQVMETGFVTVSANGSASIVSNQGFHEKHGTILFAQAHCNSPYINATVTDVTSTGLTVTFTPAIASQDGSTAATATLAISAVLISSVVTASFSAWYMVIASDA